MELAEIGFKIGMFFPAFLFALCFHEFAHGWVAKRKGDNTAELMGRLNLNPLSHVDWIGTVALPLAAIVLNWPLFGWAKPVPVNPRNLKKPKEDMFWIALAGPLSNIFLFIVGTIIFVAVMQTPLVSAIGKDGMYILMKMVYMFLMLNLFLAIFNMLPIHPLDGGKVLARFVPPEANQFLEDNQQLLMFALILLMVTGALSIIAGPIHKLTILMMSLSGVPL